MGAQPQSIQQSDRGHAHPRRDCTVESPGVSLGRAHHPPGVQDADGCALRPTGGDCCGHRCRPQELWCLRGRSGHVGMLRPHLRLQHAGGQEQRQSDCSAAQDVRGATSSLLLHLVTMQGRQTLRKNTTRCSRCWCLCQASHLDGKHWGTTFSGAAQLTRPVEPGSGCA